MVAQGKNAGNPVGLPSILTQRKRKSASQNRGSDYSLSATVTILYLPNKMCAINCFFLPRHVSLIRRFDCAIKYLYGLQNRVPGVRVSLPLPPRRNVLRSIPIFVCTKISHSLCHSSSSRKIHCVGTFREYKLHPNRQYIITLKSPQALSLRRF